MRKKSAFLFLLFGFLVYFFFASLHPFLHNHPIFPEGEKCNTCHSRHCEKDKHNEPDKSEPLGSHRNCPACNFLIKAFYTTLSDIVSPPSGIYPTFIQTILAYDFFYNETSFSYFSTRAPPVSFL